MSLTATESMRLTPKPQLECGRALAQEQVFLARLQLEQALAALAMYDEVLGTTSDTAISEDIITYHDQAATVTELSDDTEYVIAA